MTTIEMERYERFPRLEGTSLVDVLVGLAIAMIAVVVVYAAFFATDTVRRSAASTADAQSASRFALFSIASQLANAGAGWSLAARWLDTCPFDANAATTLRPIAVLITDGGTDDRADTLIVRRALAPAIRLPAAFASAAPAGSDFRVQSPDGFVAGDRVVAISRTGACAMSQVTAVSAPAGGVIAIAHTPIAVDFPITSVLVDLGPASLASTLRFDLVSQTLRSQDLANGDAPVPIASNIVNVKFQYGIDSDGDGTLDTWVRASAPGPWSPATLLAAPRTTLDRILAVRIGMIVRGDRVDGTLTGDYHWVLFDCEAADKTTCPGRLESTIAAGSSGSYRYRTLETVVPLVNVMWNRGA
ncbi:MAG TPA: PilW family protein [Casimicrobiaceae bacterium]|nr:PilW family protein [Casimicrobiaceae bacterium]